MACFHECKWCVFFLSYIEDHHLHKSLSHLKVAAVGEKTSAYLEQHGLKVDVVPKRFIAEELADALLDHVRLGERVFVAKDTCHEMS